MLALLQTLQPRKRTNKKLSHAAQIAQTMEGCIDLETPDSILVNTNLKVNNENSARKTDFPRNCGIEY